MADIPLGLSWFTLASPFSDADLGRFERVRSFGYQQVEVCIEDPHRLTAAAVARAAADTGRAVLVCGAFGPGRDISHPDPERRGEGPAYLRGCVDFAAAVGSPLVSGPCRWTRAADAVTFLAPLLAAVRGRPDGPDFPSPTDN